MGVPMCVSRFNKMLVGGIIVCGCLAFLLGHLWGGFDVRWSKLKDGMTQEEVRRALGNPTWVGTTGCIGAGGKNVTGWEYERRTLCSGTCYEVDFDYVGPGGAPVVYRRIRSSKSWNWRSLIPRHAIARA